MTAPIGTFATAIASRNRRRIIRAFRRLEATSPETADTLEKAGVNRGFLLKMLVARGVLIEVENNCFYLDEERERYTARRRRIWISLAMIEAALVVWFLGWYL